MYGKKRVLLEELGGFVKEEEDTEDLAREGQAAVVSTTSEETAVLSLLDESEDIMSRKDLESDIESDVAKSPNEEAVTLTETYGTNSVFSFMIYDNITEKFDQLEKSFEIKSDSIVESIEESEALDNELPSTIHKDTLDISKQNTPETESPPIGKEEETEAEETGEVYLLHSPYVFV